MAYEYPILDISLKAGADLSTSQYRAVKVDSSGNAVLAAAGEPATGVLQNKPKSGEAAQVRVAGVTKFEAGAVVTRGALVAADATGRAKAAVTTTANTTTGALTGSHVLGIALETASAAGQVISVLIQPAGAVPGTSA